MTVEEEQSKLSSLITTTQSSLNPFQTDSIGQQARLESEKCFDAIFAKILPKIQKRITLASSKGLWRVSVELNRSPWTLDKENQRRIVQKLTENGLSVHFKLLPNKIMLVIFWSEHDLTRTSQELEGNSEETDSQSFQKTKQLKSGPEQPPKRPSQNILSIEHPAYVTVKDPSSEPSFALVPLQATEEHILNRLDISSDEPDAAVVPRQKGLKEARLREKQQRRLARQQQIQEMKLARREEKQQHKQALKEKRQKKKEEKLTRKKTQPPKEQRALKEKNEEKKKHKVDKKKKEKEKKDSSSSSEERTWSESDLSPSSDSESD